MSNMVIQTNVMALNSHRNLRTVGVKQFNASAKLSSGYKINSAADDAAGLAISEKMRAQIRGLDMATKNTQDGISLVQTAEGGMQEIDNMIQRVRELVVQSANDTNDFETMDRKKIQDEINQLVQGIDQMAGQVEFNAKKLLDGSLTDSQTRAKLLGEVNNNLIGAIGASTVATQTTISFGHTGVASAASIGSAAAYTVWTLNNGLGTFFISSSAALGGSYTDATIAASQSYAAVASAAATAAVASGSITITANALSIGTSAGSLAALIGQVSGLNAVGTNVNAVVRLSATDLSTAQSFDAYIGLINTYIAQLITADMSISTQMTAANKAKEDALEAYAGYQEVKAWFVSQAGIQKLSGNGLWFQTGANSEQGIQVGIGSIKSDVLGIGDGYGGSYINVNQKLGQGVSGWVDVVDNALQYVTSQRSLLGAVQNRLEFTKTSLEVSSENLSASESRIRDADMGKEMMRLTAANILQQAGISMLAQANQNPQSVLQLLR